MSNANARAKNGNDRVHNPGQILLTTVETQSVSDINFENMISRASNIQTKLLPCSDTLMRNDHQSAISKRLMLLAKNKDGTDIHHNKY